MRRYPGASLCISSSLRYSFRGVVQRTATSIALLTVLVAGIFAPSGLCLLMCERHPRTETQRHCIQSSDTMPGIARNMSTATIPTIQREPELLGQTVLVIGGSAGIGFETARRARAEGARVILTGRSTQPLQRAATEIDAMSTAAFDATDPVALESFFR